MSKTKDYTHKVFKKVFILILTTMEPLTHSLHGTCIQTINKTQLSSARTACVAETMNARFRSSMEDAFVLEDDFNSKGDGLYCVFDGHGGNSKISLFFFFSISSLR